MPEIHHVQAVNTAYSFQEQTEIAGNDWESAILWRLTDEISDGDLSSLRNTATSLSDQTHCTPTSSPGLSYDHGVVSHVNHQGLEDPLRPSRRVSRVSRLASQLVQAVLQRLNSVHSQHIRRLAALPQIDDILGVDTTDPYSKEDVFHGARSAKYPKYLESKQSCFISSCCSAPVRNANTSSNTSVLR